MKFKTTIIGLLTAGALAITGAGATNAADAQEVTSIAQANTQSEFKQVLGALNAGLVKVSDNKLAYDYQRAVSLGVNKNLASEINELYLKSKASGDDGMAYTQADFWGCFWAVTGTIVSNLCLFGVVKKFGGVWKFVKAIFTGKLTKDGLLALVGETLGIKGVIDNCF